MKKVKEALKEVKKARRMEKMVKERRGEGPMRAILRERKAKVVIETGIVTVGVTVAAKIRRAARPAEADREVGAGVVGEAGCAAMNARNVENRKQHVTFFKIKVAQVAQVAQVALT